MGRKLTAAALDDRLYRNISEEALTDSFLVFVYCCYCVWYLEDEMFW